MADSKYFGIPFATSGDKATIPEATQPSGAISFTQGFGPDYERDPETDPLAKRVPRDETNELYYQVTNALKFLQLYGTPEWYAVDDAGNPVSYPLSARVRYDAGSGMQAWRSIVASNTATPGSDATKWVLDTPFNLPTLEATLAEALASSIGTKIITPRRLGPAVQQGAWNYAAAGGTANALTAALTPAPAALPVGLEVHIKISAANTGAATLNLNGLGVRNIVRADGTPLKPGDLPTGSITTLLYDGTNFQVAGVSGANAPLSGSSMYATAGTFTFTVPDGVYRVLAECWGAGGGGGGAGSNGPAAAASAGGGGAYARKWINVTPGQVLNVIVGAGGSGGSAGGGNGGNAGTSSVGGVVSAVGGSAGTGVVDTITPGAAGTGGTATGGDINISGYPGGLPVSIGPLGGIGGTTFSSSPPPPNQNAPGNAGVFPGGGGNGASRSGAGNSAGGAGARGLVIISY